MEKHRDSILSTLNVAIEAMNLAKEISSITPAKGVFGSVSALLTMIRVCLLLSSMMDPVPNCNQDSMINKTDCVDLGLACADVCRVLYRGIKGRRLDEVSQPVLEAIGELTT